MNSRRNANQAWDIKNAPEFKQPAGVSRLAIDVGWTTSEYANTGAVREDLALVPFQVVGGVPSGGGRGIAPALPVSVDAVRDAVPVTDHPGWYVVVAQLPKQAVKTGTVAIEGHPAWPISTAGGVVAWARVPVQSVYQPFRITDDSPTLRRQVVDIHKCKVCHDGELHDNITIPRLSLHGANRTEELGVCVICHNPSQTDIAYRTSGAEVPIDFKTMVHSIHSGGFRKNPFRVVGFRAAISDFSAVRFPAELRDCTKCHVDQGGKGSFELPLARSVLGTTIKSGSLPGVTVDLDPANDYRITPTAAVCSSCHDAKEAREHMVSKGARFAVRQASIDNGSVRERCADCHGPGREKDVRRIHEVGGEEHESPD